MTEPLTPESFDEHVDTEFRLPTPSGEELRIKLVSVDRLGDAPEGHRAPFSLAFTGDENVLIPQQTHSLRHDGMGDLDIFLVPLGPADGVMRYEAIFA
jgi:hypothetical protein